MLSYHNNKDLKQKIVDEMAAHKAADRIVQRSWFNDVENKGCHIGCVGHSLKLASDEANFEEISEKLGWPLWFTILQEKVFEGLSEKNAIEFSSAIVSKIPLGKNLDTIRPMLEINRLERNKARVKKLFYAKKQDVIDVIDTCINLWKENCKDDEKWSAAWLAADSAAESARSAARSAVNSAGSEWSEWSAWLAANSAAESARSAVNSAGSAWSARLAEWQLERDSIYLALDWLAK